MRLCVVCVERDNQQKKEHLFRVIKSSHVLDVWLVLEKDYVNQIFYSVNDALFSVTFQQW